MKLITIVAVVVVSLVPAVALAGTLPPGMREIETKHYKVHTDIRGDLVDDLTRRLDAMYDDYSRRLKELAPPPAGERKLPVYLFDKHDQYKAFTSMNNLGGVFAVRDNDAYLASHLEWLGRDELRRTLQHEGFHQFAQETMVDRLPLWMNEGIAEYFNDAIWNGRTFLVGQVWPRRVRRLQHDMQNRALIPLKEFTTITSKQWLDMIEKNPDKLTSYYNQAWALVYFLGDSGREGHRKRLIGFLKDIQTGQKADVAWKKAFPDQTHLQSEFGRWASGLRPTPGATMIERQETLGTMFILCQRGRSPFTSMGDFRNYAITRGVQVTTTEGKMKWKTADRPSEYFMSPGGDLYDTSTQLFFEPRADAPLPDIVCRAASDAHFRTRFYRDGDRTRHEVLVEAISSRGN